MLPLTQSHLTLLDTCPRKYQHIFFNALSGPSSYEQHLKTQWGTQFHLLMQQQALDLPVATLAPADQDMAASLKALEKAAPEVFKYLPVSPAAMAAPPSASPTAAAEREAFSQSEHRRTLTFNDYLLTVIYDLVVFEPVVFEPVAFEPTNPATPAADDRRAMGQIFDWKTHQKPPKQEWLAKDWQTRLYRFVLCETTSLTPAQISMTYWFVRVDEASQQQPSSYRFDYSLAEHDATRRDLQQLTDRLTKLRSHNYFPKVDSTEGHCESCAFNARCDRRPLTNSQGTKSGHSQDPNHLLKVASQVTLESVEEISL